MLKTATDCCAALGDIEKMCGGGNAPGLKTKVWVACLEEILSIPAADDYPTTGAPHTVSQDIVMVQDNASTTDHVEGIFHCWNISKSDNGYTATPQGEDGAQSWLVEVKMFIPRLHPLTTHILNGTIGGEFIIIPCDKQDQNRIIGDLECGASLTVAEQTNDKNGYVVTARWETSYLPYFYTGNLPT